MRCGNCEKKSIEVTNEKLGRRQFTFRRKENMLVVHFQYKKEIFQLSTMDKANIVNVRKQSHWDVQKPKVIHDYNQKKGGVKENGSMIGNYSSISKTYKWYTKIFFNFREEALFNAFVVYSKEGEKKVTKLMLFKSEVIREMLEDAHQIQADSKFDRLKGRHFVSVIPPCKSKGKPQKRCVDCHKNKV